MSRIAPHPQRAVESVAYEIDEIGLWLTGLESVFTDQPSAARVLEFDRIRQELELIEGRLRAVAEEVGAAIDPHVRYMHAGALEHRLETARRALLQIERTFVSGETAHSL